MTQSPESPQQLEKSPKSQGRGEVYLSELSVAFLFIFKKKIQLVFFYRKSETISSYLRLRAAFISISKIKQFLYLTKVSF